MKTLKKMSEKFDNAMAAAAMAEGGDFDTAREMVCAKEKGSEECAANFTQGLKPAMGK